ncbi:uncharacterized protein LOC111703732 [Eurytemora carolleeae]|uniref:uncharacterized protein LOC111703732 n=1 Tax=Eurytemora carolleeae TaxID=1294199 RepID=UPI000C77ED0F|nr:uncharacterized protein LOC111703732 [Eurytemora carolleeae]|eukprot:XP_023331536.1 uncharacterized protein LOC111703732 [Eurytemora affinis]
MATPIPIPGSFPHRSNSLSSDGTGSPGSPPAGTSFFGKSSSAKREKKTSVVAAQSPPSPSTVKRLLRIRKMSEMSRSPTAGNITTIPTEVSDISLSWTKLVINQYRYHNSNIQSLSTLQSIFSIILSVNSTVLSVLSIV